MNKIFRVKLDTIITIFILLLTLISVISNSGLINRIINGNFKKIPQQNYLPIEVVEADNFLKNAGIKQFNLSEGIKKDSLIKQRMLETLYPIRVNENANIILFNKKDKIPDECKNLYKSDNLYIYECNK